MADLMRAHIRVFGLVQGVFFRVSTQRRADTLGLHGWVRNRTDGSVEVVAEGGESSIRDLVTWCHTGSEQARVDWVEVKYPEPVGLSAGFMVRRTTREDA